MNINEINNWKNQLQIIWKKIHDDPVIVIDTYQMEVTESLINQEHNRKINIHNWDEYLKLQDKNQPRWDTINDTLHKKHYKDFQKEVFKEILLAEAYKKLTTEEINELFEKYKQTPK